jgi:hypothetical protein
MMETFICERRGIKLTVTMQTTTGDAHSILSDVGSPAVRRLLDSKFETLIAKFLADVALLHDPGAADAPHL